jgi:hypothetical protein
MTVTRSILGLALVAGVTVAQAASPTGQKDLATKLSADDNVQAQTQSEARKPAPRAHHKAAHKRHSGGPSAVTKP